MKKDLPQQTQPEEEQESLVGFEQVDQSETIVPAPDGGGGVGGVGGGGVIGTEGEHCPVGLHVNLFEAVSAGATNFLKYILSD